MKFDGKQVEMASETGAESYKPGTIITPPRFMFRPKGPENIWISGLYESKVSIVLCSDFTDKVILQGKKYKNIMEMTPMPKDIPWRIQIEDIINIEIVPLLRIK